MEEGLRMFSYGTVLWFVFRCIHKASWINGEVDFSEVTGSRMGDVGIKDMSQ